VSEMEDKTNCSRRLKQFDGLTRLILTPIFTTYILRHYALVNKWYQARHDCHSAGGHLGIFAIFEVDNVNQPTSTTVR